MDTRDLVRIAKVRALSRTGVARRLRIAADLSLPETAGAVGVSTSTMWRWEEGQRRPTGEKALRYADLLDELLDRDGQMRG
jgi:transcriptional regulator with XRE-family HTH domain